MNHYPRGFQHLVDGWYLITTNADLQVPPQGSENNALLKNTALSIFLHLLLNTTPPVVTKSSKLYPITSITIAVFHLTTRRPLS